MKSGVWEPRLRAMKSGVSGLGVWGRSPQVHSCGEAAPGSGSEPPASYLRRSCPRGLGQSYPAIVSYVVFALEVSIHRSLLLGGVVGLWTAFSMLAVAEIMSLLITLLLYCFGLAEGDVEKKENKVSVFKKPKIGKNKIKEDCKTRLTYTWVHPSLMNITLQSCLKVTRTCVILRFLYAAVYACVIQRYFYALQSAFQ